MKNLLLILLFTLGIVSADTGSVGTEARPLAGTCDAQIQAAVAHLIESYPQEKKDALKNAINLHSQLSLNRLALAIHNAKAVIDELAEWDTFTPETALQEVSTTVQKPQDREAFTQIFAAIYEQKATTSMTAEELASFNRLFNALKDYSSAENDELYRDHNTNNIIKDQSDMEAEGTPEAERYSERLNDGDALVLFSILNNNNSFREDRASHLYDNFSALLNLTGEDFRQNVNNQRMAIQRLNQQLKDRRTEGALDDFVTYVQESISRDDLSNCDDNKINSLLNFGNAQIDFVKDEQCASCSSFAEILDSSHTSMLGNLFSELTHQIPDPILASSGISQAQDVGDITCESLASHYVGTSAEIPMKQLSEGRYKLASEITQAGLVENLASNAISGTFNGEPVSTTKPADRTKIAEFCITNYEQKVFDCSDISAIGGFLEVMNGSTRQNNQRCHQELAIVKSASTTINNMNLAGKTLEIDEGLSQNFTDNEKHYDIIIAQCGNRFNINCDIDCDEIKSILTANGTAVLTEDELKGQTVESLKMIFQTEGVGELSVANIHATTQEIATKCLAEYNGANNTSEEPPEDPADPCDTFKEEFETAVGELDGKPYTEKACKKIHDDLIEKVRTENASCEEKVKELECAKESCDDFEKFFDDNYALDEDDMDQGICEDIIKEMKERFEDSDVAKSCDYSCSKKEETVEVEDRPQYTKETMPDYMKQMMMNQQTPVKASPKRIRGSGY